jgi:hypothetical protein
MSRLVDDILAEHAELSQVERKVLHANVKTVMERLAKWSGKNLVDANILTKEENESAFLPHDLLERLERFLKSRN